MTPYVLLIIVILAALKDGRMQCYMVYMGGGGLWYMFIKHLWFRKICDIVVVNSKYIRSIQCYLG